MKNKSSLSAVLSVKAFTLIELLVVVLIIGILAAVALPQYKVAVAKTRLAAIMPIVKSIKDSAEAYHLANGEYPGDTLEDLNIEIPDCQSIGGGICKKGNYVFDWLSHGVRGDSGWDDRWIDAAGYTLDGNGVLVNSFHLFADNSPSSGIKYCGASINNPTANTVCKSLGGTQPTTGKCTISAKLNKPSCQLYILP